jgi:hypothetical protein
MDADQAIELLFERAAYAVKHPQFIPTVIDVITSVTPEELDKVAAAQFFVLTCSVAIHDWQKERLRAQLRTFARKDAEAHKARHFTTVGWIFHFINLYYRDHPKERDEEVEMTATLINYLN